MTNTLPIYGLALLGLLLTTACSEQRVARPVGTRLRGSSPFGSCSYTADPSVATIDPATGSALLVGPGVLVSTCSGARVEWDVLVPTELRISEGERESGDPRRIRLQATLFAGEQELMDVACEDFHWTLGTDCSGIAELLRNSDGHWGYCPTGAVTLETAPGTCTVEATALGQRATRTLRLR